MSGQRLLTGEVIYTTDDAIRFQSDDMADAVWIPRRCAINGDLVDDGDTEVEVAAWFCDKEGIR